MKAEIELRWGVERRLEFIEFRLFWEGRINRADIVERFGVSVPQASKDLSQYDERAPGNLAYDKSEKRYVASDSFKPKFLKPDPDRYFAQLKAFADGTLSNRESWLSMVPSVDIAITPKRLVDVDVLRGILNAVRAKRSIDIYYQSMNPARPEPGWRRISPHAFGYDGFRWHTRALCHVDRTFKDFLLPRILDVGSLDDALESGANDQYWNEFFDLKIKPHPRLAPSQQAVVARDYDFEDGFGILRVRKAMLFYVLKRLGLLTDAEMDDPRRQHIVAVNGLEAHRIIDIANNITKSSGDQDQSS